MIDATVLPTCTMPTGVLCPGTAMPDFSLICTAERPVESLDPRHAPFNLAVNPAVLSPAHGARMSLAKELLAEFRRQGRTRRESAWVARGTRYSARITSTMFGNSHRQIGSEDVKSSSAVIEASERRP
jgi:hypothetical protein